MSFTYDLTTDIGKIRMELGDETFGSGVKPDNSNFSDEEIQVILDREGVLMRAVAGLCENLANRWNNVADTQVGSRRVSLGQVSQKWSGRAAALRKQYGGGTVSPAYSIQPKRTDGFSQAQETDEYATD